MKTTTTNAALTPDLAQTFLDSRRDFLKKLGGGIIVTFSIGK